MRPTHRPFEWTGTVLPGFAGNSFEAFITTLSWVMHWLFVYIVWMVYILLAMGVLEAASDRTDDLRGARAALLGGAFVGAILTVAILWFGPVDPFA